MWAQYILLLAHVASGYILATRGDLESLIHFKMAIEIDPTFFEPFESKLHVRTCVYVYTLVYVYAT